MTIGLVLGVVLLLAVWLLPRVLPSQERAAVTAQEAVSDAHTALAAYDPLFAAAHRATHPELPKSDIDQLVARAEAPLQQIAQRSTARANELQKQARAAGVRLQVYTPISANASAVRDAVNRFEQVQRDNQARLGAAAKSAGEARSASANSLTGPHVAGLASFVDAANAFSEAQATRLEMHRILAQARAIAADLRTFQIERAYFEALSDKGIIEDLKQTTADLAARREEVATRLASLRDEVQQRETRIAELSSDIGAQTEQLAQLEQTGGARMGAEEFARQIRAGAGRVQLMHLELQVLQNGGRQGATLAGDNGLLDALIEGGTPVRPLGTLREELAGADETHARLAKGEAELAGQIEQIEARAVMAAEQVAAREQVAAPMRSSLGAALDQAAKLAAQATDAEAQSLQRSQQAASSFAAATQAAAQWKNAARTTQSDYDPDRKSWRLKMIQADPTAELLGTAAAAEARKLALQVHVQRLDAADDLLATAAAVEALSIADKLDSSAIRRQADEAREAGRALATELVQSYGGPLANQLPAALKPLALASLAAAQQALASLARPDNQAAAEHRAAAAKAVAEYRAAALRSITSAAEAIGKNPTVGPRLAVFRDAIAAPPPTSAPAASGPASSQSSTSPATQPAESDDLFDEG